MDIRSSVVITGMGVVTPHGCSIDSLHDAIVTGSPCEDGALAMRKNGVVAIDHDCLSSNAQYLEKKDLSMDDRRAYIREAAGRAWTQASLSPSENIGVAIGCGKPMMGRSERWIKAMNKLSNYSDDPVFNVPIAAGVEVPSVYVAKQFDLRGPLLNVTAGCTTGLLDIIAAARILMMGDADIMIAGAVEVIPEQAFLPCYKNMKALTDAYEQYRPFHKQRNGFFISEGAAVVVLETEQSAQKRGVQPLARIEQWCCLNDPSGLTAMNEDGLIISELFKRLSNAGHIPIDYVNLHGTGTMMNDRAEAAAVCRVFGAHRHRMSFSSTKPITGHMLGATSALEVIISVLALLHNVVPPTIRLDDPDDFCDFDLTPLTSVKKELKRVMSVSYGFGGPMAGIRLGDARG